MVQNALPGVERETADERDDSHAAERLLFEQMLGELPFADRYYALLAGGWGWRKASYIAWQSIPRNYRRPETMQEFASVIGLSSTKAIREWRTQNPAIDLAVAKMAQALVWERIPDAVEALMESASNAGYKHAPDRRVALEMAGLYVPRSKMVVEENASEPERKSDAELARLAGMETEDDAG